MLTGNRWQKVYKVVHAGVQIDTLSHITENRVTPPPGELRSIKCLSRETRTQRVTLPELLTLMTHGIHSLFKQSEEHIASYWKAIHGITWCA